MQGIWIHEPWIAMPDLQNLTCMIKKPAIYAQKGGEKSKAHREEAQLPLISHLKTVDHLKVALVHIPTL